MLPDRPFPGSTVVEAVRERRDRVCTTAEEDHLIVDGGVDRRSGGHGTRRTGNRVVPTAQGVLDTPLRTGAHVALLERKLTGATVRKTATQAARRLLHEDPGVGIVGASDYTGGRVRDSGRARGEPEETLARRPVGRPAADSTVRPGQDRPARGDHDLPELHHASDPVGRSLI
jgi:hypothetical protein